MSDALPHILCLAFAAMRCGQFFHALIDDTQPVDEHLRICFWTWFALIVAILLMALLG